MPRRKSGEEPRTDRNNDETKRPRVAYDYAEASPIRRSSPNPPEVKHMKHVNPHTLATVLTVANSATPNDRTLPTLETVQVRATAHTLTLSATDRYRAITVVQPTTDDPSDFTPTNDTPDEWSALWHRTDVAALVKTLKTVPKDAGAEITHNPTTHTSAVRTYHHGSPLTMTAVADRSAGQSDFPKLDTLHISAAPDHGAPTYINPRYLSEIMAAAAKMDPKTPALVVPNPDPKKPLTILANYGEGRLFRALLMPITIYNGADARDALPAKAHA